MSGTESSEVQFVFRIELLNLVSNCVHPVRNGWDCWQVLQYWNKETYSQRSSSICRIQKYMKREKGTSIDAENVYYDCCSIVIGVFVWAAEQVILAMSGPSQSEQWLYWKSQTVDQMNRCATIRELEKLLQSDVVRTVNLCHVSSFLQVIYTCTYFFQLLLIASCQPKVSK